MWYFTNFYSDVVLYCLYFLLVVYSRFDCEVLSRLSFVFLFWEWYRTLLVFLKLSSHKWEFSLSMADIYRSVSNVVVGPRQRWEQPWAQATPSIMRDICRAVYNVVTGPRPCPIYSRDHYDDINHDTRQPHLWATVWVQITMSSVGELKPPFWQQWFQITRNCKH